MIKNKLLIILILVCMIFSSILFVSCAKEEEELNVVWSSKGLKFDLETGAVIEYNGDSPFVEIPSTNKDEKIAVIEKNVFKQNETIKCIKFSTNILFVNEWAFFNCKNLIRVYIPSIELWLSVSFENAASNPLNNGIAELYLNDKILDEVNIPTGLEKIQDYTFENYKALKKVTIPDSVKQIGSSFYGCTGLKEIEYLGTIRQWEAIEKVDDWNAHVKDCKIICIDGEIV